METIILIVIALLIYDIIKFTVNFIGEIMFSTKQWTPRMKNPPPPPKRKSFKERLREKAESWNDGPIDMGPKPPPRHHGLYQPTDKVDTSNPPKETGT